MPVWFCPLLSGASRESPHDAFYYFLANRLEAVRSGGWKLRLSWATEGVFAKSKPKPATDPVMPARGPELYDLDADIGETRDVSTDHPDVVKRLRVLPLLTPAALALAVILGDDVTALLPIRPDLVHTILAAVIGLVLGLAVYGLSFLFQRRLYAEVQKLVPGGL